MITHYGLFWSADNVFWGKPVPDGGGITWQAAD